MQRIEEYNLIGFEKFSVVEVIARLFISVMILYQYSQTMVTVTNYDSLMFLIGIIMIYWMIEPFMKLFNRRGVIKQLVKESKE